MKRSFYSSLILLSISFFLILSSCKKDEGPTAPQNHAPKIGSLVANPTTVLINMETSLTCVATDEDGDNLTITWSSKRGTFTNGSVGVSVKWTAPTTAGKDTITVTVNDSRQTTQGKLEIIVGTISSSPTLLTPSDNTAEIALSPTVSWNGVSSAASYTLQVSTNNVFTSYVYDQSGLTNTTQQISGLNSNTTYFWRVNSSNIYGTSSWSNVFSFKTVAPPQAPTLIFPINNAPDVALSPTLTWNAVSNAVNYTLQVSTNNSFSSFVYNQSDLANTTQQISGLNSNTTYFWRVNSSNIYGTSSWSNVFSFKTVAPPQAPTLIFPINNAPDVALSPTLTWNAVSNAVNYTLQVSTNNSFSSFVYNQSDLANTNQIISGLNIATTYYWRVNSSNIYGTSSWSNVYSFKTVTPPQAPTLLSPSSGADNISISPTFIWNVSIGATSYALQVSTTNSFSSFVNNQSGLINTNQAITGLSIFTIYYWRVNATNSYGTSSWSNYQIFTTISAPCPNIPTVTYAGKTYNTALIGTQCWLKENLNVGSKINGSQNQSNNGTIEKYCWNDDENYCNTYGGLYQWNEAMANSTTPGTKGICPNGWHIPTYAELQTLGTAANNNGNSLKAIGQGVAQGDGTNISGFSALLAGYRLISSTFTSLGHNAEFWSSTTEYNTNYAYFITLDLYDGGIYFDNFSKDYGFSIRCLKD